MARDVSGGVGTRGVMLFASDGSTWSFDPDALRWSKRQEPQNGPGARTDASMAFDGSGVVLFGGQIGGQYLNDTWEWNGSTWHRQFPLVSPQARAGAAMTFAPDALGQVGNAAPGELGNTSAGPGSALLFGGETGGSVLLGDTWEWSGGSWTLLSPSPPAGVNAPTPSPGANVSPVPPPRVNASLATAADTSNVSVVLFGGSGAQGPMNDLWSWNGAGWSGSPASTPAPSPRSRAAFGDEGDGCGLAVFSGDGQGNDTWLGGATGFTRRDPAVAPAARSSAGAAYALALTPNPGTGGPTDMMVLFGGTGSDGTPLGDTWTLEPQWLPPAGQPICGTSHPATGGAVWTLVNDGSQSGGGSSSSSSSDSSTTSTSSSSTSVDAGAGGCPAVSPGPRQVLYPAGYSLVGLPRGTVVGSDSPLFGWLDEGDGGRYFTQDASEPVDGSVGYWAWSACPHVVTLTGDGAPSASRPLHAGHASLVGNPSATQTVAVSGFDYAARWDPQTGTYRMSRYQEAQSLAVGEAIWVFSSVDTTVRIAG